MLPTCKPDSAANQYAYDHGGPRRWQGCNPEALYGEGSHHSDHQKQPNQEQLSLPAHKPHASYRLCVVKTLNVAHSRALGFSHSLSGQLLLVYRRDASRIQAAVKPTHRDIALLHPSNSGVARGCSAVKL